MPSGAPGHEHRPLSVVAVLAGAGALILGIVPFAGLAVLSWLTSTWNGDGGSAPDAMRVGLHLWLAGHHVPVTVYGNPMTVAPLGITIAIVGTLVAAGGQLARHALILNWLDAAKAATGLGGVYGAGLLLTAALSAGAGSHANPMLAFVAGFVIAVLAGGAGVLRRTPQLVGELRVLLPMPVRAGAVGALVATGAIVAGGLVLTVVSLVLHHQRVGVLFGLYHGGWFSAVVLALVCVALLPNAAAFGAAYLLGPGFAIGTQTLVSPMVVELGKVPALPLLAALPSPGQPPVTMAFAYAIAVVAGALGLAGALRSRGAARRRLACASDRPRRAAGRPHRAGRGGPDDGPHPVLRRCLGPWAAVADRGAGAVHARVVGGLVRTHRRGRLDAVVADWAGH